MRKKRTEEQKQKDLEYGRKRIKEGSEIVFIPCRLCKKPSPTKKYKEKMHLKRGGITCQECRAAAASERLKKIRAAQTTEERSRIGKLARSKVIDIGKSVKKQWETIKSNPEKLKEVCKSKSIRMQQAWTRYTSEKRDYIIGKLSRSNGKMRSEGSEKLKQLLINNNLYDGFVSEEIFHGFIPDEINHDLKIIIEFYGDIYHCNPKRYKDPNQFLKIIGRTVGEQWHRDRKRLACFYKHGYTVIIIWDKEFTRYPEIQLKRIKDEIDKKKKAFGKI